MEYQIEFGELDYYFHFQSKEKAHFCVFNLQSGNLQYCIEWTIAERRPLYLTMDGLSFEVSSNLPDEVIAYVERLDKLRAFLMQIQDAELDVVLANKQFVLGSDEVGYGCLAGPLVVAAVRAPKGWALEGLNDSKKLSEKKRESMRTKLEDLIERRVIQFHLAERSNIEIDTIGLAPALKSAYVECFHKLYQPDSLIVSDGILKFDELGVDAYDKVSLVKADTKVPAVMAASILAKTYRDRLMKTLHKKYPVYGWDTNVGYGAADHKKGLESYGVCPLHRFSYAPIKTLLEEQRSLYLGVADGQ